MKHNLKKNDVVYTRSNSVYGDQPMKVRDTYTDSVSCEDMDGNLIGAFPKKDLFLASDKRFKARITKLKKLKKLRDAEAKLSNELFG